MLSQGSRNEITLGDGRQLSYRDFDGPGRVLLALHGHFSEGVVYSDLAERLGSEWRVVAPDQRGHGDSDRAPSYTREGYVEDLKALVEHLDVGPVVAVGHSMGGINAIALAARYPELVSALVAIEATVDDPGPIGLDLLHLIERFPYTAEDPDELIAAAGPLGPTVAPFLRPIRVNGSKTLWRLPFHPGDTVASELLLRTDHWDDWTSSRVPGLLIRGQRSPILSDSLARAMVARREGPTVYAEIDTDHFVHTNAPGPFARTVADFLQTIPN